MGKNVIFMSLAMLYFLISIVSSLNSSSDEYALLSFKSQITDPNKILAKNWSQGTSFCNWIGITCGRRHRRVKYLNLAYMGLGGTIAKEIGELSFLRSLIISNNNFHGFIPDEIGNLSQLREIEMQENEINGPIPASLGSLENLQKLNLSDNTLDGNVPNRIFNLSSLIEIGLSKNSLTGSLPLDICCNLTKLEKLRISWNQISGNIPPSLGTCKNLELLSLSYNHFSGRIPMEVGNLSKLQSLDLGGNNLTGWILVLSGEIPASISYFSKLTRLYLGHNSFTGRVPMNLGNLQNLQILSFRFNQLTNDPSMLELDFLVSLENCRKLKIIRMENNSFDGILPKSMGNLSASIERFDADLNGIKGIIPNEIGNLSNLIELGIGNNELTGKIPDTLGQLRNLQELRLYDNKLQGSLPVNLCNLVNLYLIDLGVNKLSQQLPTCLGNLTALREIYVDYNSLTSSIPSTLWNNKEIQFLNLAYNFLSGSLAPEIGNIKSMILINLSGNRFSGDIPSTIGQLQNLEDLILSNNRLYGPIPESFSNLISLQNLDLSNNSLYGVIPKSLEKLDHLQYFNVSFNELNGEIPNGGPFKNFTSDFFTGNRELCGASQFLVKSCKDNKTRLSRSSSILKYILPSIVVVLSLAIIVVYLIRRHGRNTLLPARSGSPIAVKRISYYEVLNATNKFGEENLIDKGSIGSVYKGIFSDGMIAAIKLFNLDLEAAHQSFDNECQILCNIRHRNLVKVISSCSNLDLKALVLEYMPNGNLTRLLSSSNYLLNIAQSILLLDEDMVAHVADFGISMLFTEDQRILITKTLGTIGYMSPEYGSTGLLSTMADVYSYGIMMMEIFTKKKPTDAIFVGEFTMRKWVLESFPDAITHIVDVDLLNATEDNIRAKESCFRLIMELALECTNDLPVERLNIKDVLTRLKKIKTQFC
ncbi:unnamed protein product [Fraxinus pennsylvanica]|uniref:non-specific serine/threonine protein kinase n=1 Tax=Fraxinus pennsylvanica TaxID=56036 RepID=A0AAD1YTG2_9LAMI|nr:unnamed protein product [Fraxinus pennsylvanica]